MSDEIVVTQEDGLAILALNRPPVNALTPSLFESLAQACESVGSMRSVKSVLLRGNGRGFCAGADTKARGTMSPDEMSEMRRAARLALRAVFDVPVPMVTVIHGFAIGGGFSLASLTDIRVAADTAVIGMPEISVGSMAVGAALLPRLGIPTGRVRELVYSGRTYAADDAREIGLVDYVVGEDLLESAARGVIEGWLQNDRDDLISAKQSLREAERHHHWEDKFSAVEGVAHD